MKKKGFTLIELLAVIVILAIIALIATPLVLKYIEKSRQESKVDSAYSFIRNLETQMANYAIEHNGTKYTTDKENIKDLSLNTTVKGENPDDGKVCISSLGQVEKGIFKYGNYYVSYDGKKSSISDETIYTGFSCSGNSNVVFDGNMLLTYNDDEWGYMLEQCLDQTKFKNNAKYKITIDNINGGEKSYEVISSFGKEVIGEDSSYNDILSEAFVLGSQNELNYEHVKDLNSCYFRTYDETFDFSGNHHVKIEYVGENNETHVLKVSANSLAVFSTELVEGDAVLEIKDSSGNVETLNVYFKNNGTLRKIYIYNSSMFKLYYEMLKNGDIITVTITQGDKKYILGGSTFNYDDDPYCFGEYYYWGNNKLGYWFGC